MLVVLVYTAVPNLVIGRVKERLALALHDRVLYADAGMNRDDWLTASGAMIGVVGIGFGVWWGRETGCRVRELGHVLHLVTFVGSVTETQLVEARHRVESLTPVLAEVVIVPVAELPEALTTRQAAADPGRQ